MIFAVCAIALAFGFFGSMPLAGPISVMVVSRAVQQRYGEALRIAIGAAVAEGLYAGGAFFGFTELLASHPIVVPISHGVTAVVLAGLGIRFAFWKPRGRKGEEHKSGTALVGFTLSAINPTLLVTWGAAVAFLYSKGLHVTSSLASLPFGISAAAGIAAWFTLLVLILKRLEGKFPERVLTWAIRALGVALVGLGAWSGVQLAQWLHGDRREQVPHAGRGTPAAVAASLCSPRADHGPGDRARHGRGDRDA